MFIIHLLESIYNILYSINFYYIFVDVMFIIIFNIYLVILFQFFLKKAV